MRADTPHIFRAQGAAALLFVEPESDRGRALHEKFFADCEVAELASADAISALDGLRDCFRSRASDDELRSLGRTILEDLTATKHPIESQFPCPNDDRLRATKFGQLAEPRVGSVAGQPVVKPGSAFVRHSHMSSLQVLRLMAADPASRAALRRGSVTNRGGTRGWLCRFCAFQPDMQARTFGVNAGALRLSSDA